MAAGAAGRLHDCMPALTVAIPVIVAACGAVAWLFRIGYVVRSHNRTASRIYEDLHDWYLDERRKQAAALEAVEHEARARGLHGGGLARQGERSVRDAYEETWRKRKREAKRSLEDLEDAEHILHRCWRRVGRTPWPENPYAAANPELALDRVQWREPEALRSAGGG